MEVQRYAPGAELSAEADSGTLKRAPQREQLPARGGAFCRVPSAGEGEKTQLVAMLQRKGATLSDLGDEMRGLFPPFCRQAPAGRASLLQPSIHANRGNNRAIGAIEPILTGTPA